MSYTKPQKGLAPEQGELSEGVQPPTGKHAQLSMASPGEKRAPVMGTEAAVPIESLHPAHQLAVSLLIIFKYSNCSRSLPFFKLSFTHCCLLNIQTNSLAF